mmetsp:Transcript_71670/g.226423  ORF Transcript_71670/g.226423 Transcript_71670/m.226423 type:complete len:261 (-) Transcript_71670:13-795(-)
MHGPPVDEPILLPPAQELRPRYQRIHSEPGRSCKWAGDCHPGANMRRESLRVRREQRLGEKSPHAVGDDVHLPPLVACADVLDARLVRAQGRRQPVALPEVVPEAEEVRALHVPLGLERLDHVVEVVHGIYPHRDVGVEDVDGVEPRPVDVARHEYLLVLIQGLHRHGLGVALAPQLVLELRVRVLNDDPDPLLFARRLCPGRELRATDAWHQQGRVQGCLVPLLPRAVFMPRLLSTGCPPRQPTLPRGHARARARRLSS